MGVIVGVGCGISRGWLIYKVLQAVGILFNVTMLCTETLKNAAMLRQLSFALTR